MKLKGRINIGRPSNGDGREYMKIEIEDDNSHIRFLTLEIGLAEFTKALTNEYGIPVNMDLRGLENVGKIKETKALVFEIPNDWMKRKETARKLAVELAESGWTPDLYFGSQSSFSDDRKTGKTYAHTHQYRYVEIKE